MHPRCVLFPPTCYISRESKRVYADNNDRCDQIASNPGVSNSVGRVAAASLAFTGGSSSSSTTPSLRSQPPQLPSLPQRSTGTLSTSSSGSEIDKLVQRKVSTALHLPRSIHIIIIIYSFQTGVLNALKKGPTVKVAIPPAFPQPKSTFGPPPVRRATSDTSAPETSKSPPPILPRRQAEPELEEPQGEWAEVLYDYTSEV